MHPVTRGLLAAIKHLLTVIAALALAIEQWGWRPLTAMAAWVAKWPPLARLEDRIKAASPRVALTLFLVPATMLLPLKLAALWLVQQDHPWLGVLLIVAAKLIGTALVGRLFIICEPQLMTFPWFVRALTWWRATKARIHAALAASPSWRATQRMRRWLGTRGRRWWRTVTR
ncbi:hypothetical protein BH09PSE5_BH09PSE5_30120 [soil metagenome]